MRVQWWALCVDTIESMAKHRSKYKRGNENKDTLLLQLNVRGMESAVAVSEGKYPLEIFLSFLVTLT